MGTGKVTVIGRVCLKLPICQLFLKRDNKATTVKVKNKNHESDTDAHTHTVCLVPHQRVTKANYKLDKYKELLMLSIVLATTTGSGAALSGNVICHHHHHLSCLFMQKFLEENFYFLSWKSVKVCKAKLASHSLACQLTSWTGRTEVHRRHYWWSHKNSKQVSKLPLYSFFLE